MTRDDDTISSHSPAQQFTALAYSADDLLPPPIDPASVIIILVFDPEASTLEARIEPHWDRVVLEHDREYISTVLEDFRQRIRLDPIHLLEQISNLNVGPLVTAASGFDLGSNPEILNLFEKFITL
jgi:hypothetical protein